jgi:hypothetical protein
MALGDMLKQAAVRRSGVVTSPLKPQTLAIAFDCGAQTQSVRSLKKSGLANERRAATAFFANVSFAALRGAAALASNAMTSGTFNWSSAFCGQHAQR